MSSVLTFAQLEMLDIVASQVPDARVIDWAEVEGRGGPIVWFGDGRRFLVTPTGKLRALPSVPPTEPLAAVA